MNTRKKAAIYVRANTPTEIMTQTLELMLYAEAQNYQIGSTIYRDEGNNCRPLERTGLRKLLISSSSKDFSVVLATSPDRVSRNRESLYSIEALLSIHKKKIIFIRTAGAEL